MRPTAAAKDGLLPDSGKPFDPERPPDPGLIGNRRACQLRQAGQLAGASGHHQSAARLGGVA